MTPTETLHKKMRMFLEARSCRDAEKLAAQFSRGITKEELIPLVAHAFRDLIRKGTRMEEIAVLNSYSTRPARTVEGTRLAMQQLAALLDEPYRIGDGKARLFRYMTLDDHRDRLGLLDQQIAGLKRARQIHEHAIALLEQNSAACLNDLNDLVMAEAA